SVDDVALLARALRVSPTYLMFPINDDVAVKFTPTEPIRHEPFRVRLWARGDTPLLVDPAAQFGTLAEPPRSDFDRSFWTWAPSDDAILHANILYSMGHALLMTLKIVILDYQAGVELPWGGRINRRAEIRRLKHLFHSFAEEITDYLNRIAPRTLDFYDPKHEEEN